jgi:CheY-like chemotaxis protein
VPITTSGYFIFDAKRNITFPTQPDRHMKTSRASKLVVVIEDDPLVLEATDSLLRSWGCRVIAAGSYGDAIMKLSEIRQRPDLIVCDYRLPQGPTGVDAIEMLRNAFEIPALLISGDAAAPPASVELSSYNHLHKPLDAARFRAALVEADVLQP